MILYNSERTQQIWQLGPQLKWINKNLSEARITESGTSLEHIELLLPLLILFNIIKCLGIIFCEMFHKEPWPNSHFYKFLGW